MLLVVAEEDTETRAKSELPIIVWAQIRPARAAKGVEKGVIGVFTSKACERSCVLQVLGRHAVD
jgi:hypothetical protein